MSGACAIAARKALRCTWCKQCPCRKPGSRAGPLMGLRSAAFKACCWEGRGCWPLWDAALKVSMGTVLAWATKTIFGRNKKVLSSFRRELPSCGSFLELEGCFNGSLPCEAVGSGSCTAHRAHVEGLQLTLWQDSECQSKARPSPSSPPCAATVPACLATVDG